MISQEEAKDFIRRYREVVLETPYGEVHVCGSKEVYEELIGQGKLAFSPIELLHLQKATENGSLETIVKIKSLFRGRESKTSFRWRKNRRPRRSRANFARHHRRLIWTNPFFKR